MDTNRKSYVGLGLGSISVTFSDLEGHQLFEIRICSMCYLWHVHTRIRKCCNLAYDFNCRIKNRHPEVTGSHVHYVSGNRKRCSTETLLLQISNRKWCTYWITPFPMTLSDLHVIPLLQAFSNAMFFVCSSWKAFNWLRASCHAVLLR